MKQRTDEQMALVPQFAEETVELVRIDEQVVEVPFPQDMKEVVERTSMQLKLFS